MHRRERTIKDKGDSLKKKKTQGLGWSLFFSDDQIQFICPHPIDYSSGLYKCWLRILVMVNM